MVVTIEVEPDVIDMLLQLGRLNDRRSEDRAEVATEVADVLRAWVQKCREDPF